jgi:hypothetical protein
MIFRAVAAPMEVPAFAGRMGLPPKFLACRFPPEWGTASAQASLHTIIR